MTTRAGRRLRDWALAGLTALAAVTALAGPPVATPADCTPPPPPTAADARAAQDRGALWQLRRDGVTSWLYGTVHVGRREWMAPGPTVQAALRQSAVLALEIDLASPAVQAALQRESQALAQRAPPLPPALRARIAALAPGLCLAPALLADLHPALQLMTLTSQIGAADGLHPAYAQEWALSAYARAAGLPVESLETVAQQLGALVPDPAALDLPATEQALRQMEDGTARRVLHRLAPAWVAGDLDDLARLPQWCACMDDADGAAAMRRMNDERNPGLADAIARLHARGRPVFAAVGLLHMTGPQALPALLAARGFAVERVAFAPR